MPSAIPALAPLRVSTRGVADPAAALRRLNERGALLPLQPLAGLPCEVELLKWPFEQLGMLSGRLAGLRHGTGHGGPWAHADDEHLYLGITVAGSSIVQQRGREASLRDGDAALLSPADGFEIEHPRRVQMVGLRLSRQRLATSLDAVDDLAPRTIRRDSAALSLLLRYSLIAAHDSVYWSGELQQLAVRQIYELAALATGAARQAAHERLAPGVRAARLRVMQADIQARLGDPALGASSLARQHGVSARYVHTLFEGAGLSCSAFIVSQRLERVHRQLTDPRCATQTISALAFEAGFNDLSYFGRTFRRRYGCTPSDVRHARHESEP